MAQTKYFEAILAVRGTRPPMQGDRLPAFNFDALGRSGLRDRLIGALVEKAIPLILRFGRAFAPVIKLNGVHWVSRAADVEAVLGKPEVFPVPYGPEMADLCGFEAEPPGTEPAEASDEINFVLGMEGPNQQRQNAIIRRAFLKEDVDRVGAYAGAFARSLIEGGKGRIDVVADLSYRVPTEVCRRYFGLDITDPDAFAEWAIAISALLFADPYGDPATREHAHSAAIRLRRMIDSAIARAAPARGATMADMPRLTLVERLVALAALEPELGISDAEIRAILLGLVVGFIPTNGLASAKMIEAVLARSTAFAQARDAASNGDAERMERILLEAGRLNPALAPGQWRVCPAGATVAGRAVPAGATLMVSTASALRDRRRFRRPGAFDADRPGEPELIFGHGIHWCLGKHLALRIIREALLPLFAQPGLRRAPGRAGRMQRTGYFPRRLDMDYDGPSSLQTQVIVAIPVVTGCDVKTLRDAVRAFGNPARPEAAAALDASKIVHFSSCSVIDAGTPAKPAPHLLIEINGDGSRAAVIAGYADAMNAWLGPAVQSALGNAQAPLADALSKHALDLHFGPWGSTGLHYVGTGEFSVSDIARQEALAAHARKALDEAIAQASAPRGGLGTRALPLLAQVRQSLHAASWSNASDPAALAADAALVKPRRGGLAFARRQASESFWAPFKFVLAGGLGRRILVVGALTWVVAFLLGYHGWRQGEWLSLPTLARDLATFFAAFWPFDGGRLVAGLVRALVMTALAFTAAAVFWAALLGGIALAFRRAEALEKPEDEAPDLDHLAEIGAREDAPGHAQNHIIAVTPLKRGLLRRLSLAFALWGIRQSLCWFRPGFVVTMGTIHYARWFRLPGTDTMIFQSNYDGSWESYLEDFITRAHAGQTAAWSNGIGFPRSEWLVNKGAEDGDRFKRWVRRQQVATDFWYSRFPHLTTREIRRNALIEDGLARARTDTSAATWIDLFGSAPRQEYELESDEIQSLVFRGLGRARYSACIPLLLPPGRESEWLGGVRDGAAGEPLAFGQFPHHDRALYVALSPAGLERFRRLAEGDAVGVDPLAQFPGLFVAGMAARHKILRDPDPGEGRWRWADRAVGAAPVAEAVLLVYAPDAHALDDAVRQQVTFLEGLGGAVVHGAIRTVPIDEHGRVQPPAVEGHVSYEHFGFRDGISQPVIRGMERFSPGSAQQDIVAPGEFVLGYRNNQGYFPPCITVSADSDHDGHLPLTAEGTAFGHAGFDEVPDQAMLRDFGRNGSFLVIRQLSQDVAGFHAAAEAHAEALRARYGGDPLRMAVGDQVTAEWVAAKMMGRWRDGRPLIGEPRAAGSFDDDRPNNDFLYGRDDPRGHQCPLGAHIRRSNPRDSLEPGDPMEASITNRHRLLRRGRTYLFDAAAGDYLTADPHGEVERGILFMALCGDLERQFEFVQQSWVGAPAFHGLTDEPDPIAADGGQPGARRFTIPTASAPLTLDGVQSYVAMTGGGYFFLPSRSAIDYLAALDAGCLRN